MSVDSILIVGWCLFVLWALVWEASVVKPEKRRIDRSLWEAYFDSGVLWGITAYIKREGDIESAEKICELARHMRDEDEARREADKNGQNLVNAAKKLLEKK